MTAFVNDQIDEIEEQKAGTIEGGIQKENYIEHQPANGRRAGDRFPGAELLF